MDPTNISDGELAREYRRRIREKNEAYQQEKYTRYLEECQRQEVLDRKFAAGQRVTWEQYQAIEDYVVNKIEDGR